jgi:hypothetical protein
MRRRVPFLLLAFAVFAATLPLWWQPAPYYVMDDGLGHLFRILEFDRVVHEGVFYPRWAPDLAFGYGYPVFNFYAPLTDYLAESLHIFGLTLPDAIKAILALAVLIAAVGAYVLGTELYPDHEEQRWIGVLVASAYVLFPYFLLDLYTRAAIAEALAAALLPWLVWAWRRLLHDQTIGSVVLAALVSAALVLTHNLTALVTVPLLGVYLFWEWIHLPAARRMRSLQNGSVAVLVGALLAAIYWLPLFAELPLVGMSRADQQLRVLLEENFLSLRDLVQFSWAYQYVGAPFPLALTPMLLGIVSALAVLFWGRDQRAKGATLFFVAGAVVSMVLMIDWTKGLWLALPLLRSIQFPWRLSVFVGFGVALAIGGLAASLWQGKWLNALRTRSARAAGGMTLAFAAIIVGLLVWVGISNLSPRRMNNLQGDVALPQLVRFEMNSKPIGLGSMNEYMPLTVQALPRRLNPVAAGGTAPAIRLEEYNAVRRAFTISTSQPISVSLHSFYFPDWWVTIDDQPVHAFPSTTVGLLTLDIPAGSHRIEIDLIDTAPRQIGTWLSVAGMLVLLGLASVVVYRRETETGAILVSLALGVSLLAPTALLAWQSLPPAVQPTEANVSPELSLIGVQVEDAAWLSDSWRVASPRDVLRLAVYWQVKRSLQDKPTAWRLVDENGRAWAERELFSRYAAGLPLTWVPNEIVPDHYDLPLDPGMPSGRYALQVAYGDSREYVTATKIELQEGSAPAPAQPVIDQKVLSRLGDSIQLVGYTLGAPLRPGQISPVVLYWKAESPVPVDYTAFVQLIDDQGNLVAQHDGLTGDGFDTSALWVPGRVVQDWHDLAVPREIKPGLYRLIAGLYLLQDLKRLPVVDEAGESSPDDVVELGEVKLPMNAQAAQPSHALDLSVGPSIRLLGYDLAALDARGEIVSRGNDETPSRLSIRPTQILELKLYWQARASLSADYKVFVHLIDDQGKVVAQRDVFPADNRYPTRIWETDEKVVDTHLLPLKQLSPGRYRIVVGMYNPENGERLSAVDAHGKPLPDRAIPVGNVEVSGP